MFLDKQRQKRVETKDFAIPLALAPLVLPRPPRTPSRPPPPRPPPPPRTPSWSPHQHSPQWRSDCQTCQLMFNKTRSSHSPKENVKNIVDRGEWNLAVDNVSRISIILILPFDTCQQTDSNAVYLDLWWCKFQETKLRKFEAKVGQKTGQLSTAENPCCWKPSSRLLSPTERLLPSVVNGCQATHQKIICHASYNLIKGVFALGAQGVINESVSRDHLVCAPCEVSDHTLVHCMLPVWGHCEDQLVFTWYHGAKINCTLWSIWPHTCYIAPPCPFAICWATNYVTTDLVWIHDMRTQYDLHVPCDHWPGLDAQDKCAQVYQLHDEPIGHMLTRDLNALTRKHSMHT